jgi:hypothetical protein
VGPLSDDEADWMFCHDALSLMMAKETIKWMEEEGHYERWILPQCAMIQILPQCAMIQILPHTPTIHFVLRGTRPAHNESTIKPRALTISSV